MSDLGDRESLCTLSHTAGENQITTLNSKPEAFLVFFSCSLAYQSLLGAYATSLYAIDRPSRACFWENSRYSFEEKNKKEDHSKCPISIPVTSCRLLFLSSSYHYLTSCVFSLFILFISKIGFARWKGFLCVSSLL